MVTVNGKQELLKESVSVRRFLEQGNYRTDRVAVEKNGTIVPKKNYEETMINDGDKIEIVSFVGGG